MKNTINLLLFILILGCNLDEIPDAATNPNCNLAGTPEACVQASAQSCVLGNCTITFDAACSKNACLYKWDTDGNPGDYEIVSPDSSSITLTFSELGSKTVILTVENKDGDEDETSVQVNVMDNVTTFELFNSVGSNGNEAAYDHTIDAEGNFVLCGISKGISEEAPFAFKVLRNGALAWSKFLTASNIDGIKPLASVIDHEDTYIFTTEAWLEAPSFKTGLEGNIIPNSEFSFPEARVNKPVRIDGLIAYYSYTNAFCIPICPDFVVFADENGNNFTPSGMMSAFDRPVWHIRSLEVDEENNLLLSGYSYVRLDNDASLDSTKVAFTRLTAASDYSNNDLIETEYDLPNALQERVVDSAIDDEGNIYHLIFASDSPTNGIALIKTDKEGRFVFPAVFRSYAESGADNDIPVSIDIGLDGNIYIAGHTESFSFGTYKIFLLKLDPDGNPLWSPRYKLYGSNTKDNVAVKMTVDPIDGGIVVSGMRDVDNYTPPFSTSVRGDFYLLKVDQDGKL